MRYAQAEVTLHNLDKEKEERKVGLCRTHNVNIEIEGGRRRLCDPHKLEKPT